MMSLNKNENIKKFKERIDELRILSKTEEEKISEKSACFALRFYKDALEKYFYIEHPSIVLSVKGNINFIWASENNRTSIYFECIGGCPFHRFYIKGENKEYYGKINGNGIWGILEMYSDVDIIKK